MNNGTFIIINNKLFNFVYISSIRTIDISYDSGTSYIIRVGYAKPNLHDDVHYDSKFERDEDYNRILQELTNN